MDTKLKTSEIKDESIISKGFIISLIAIIITSIALNLYVGNVLDERRRDAYYFRSGDFINSTGSFRSIRKINYGFIGIGTYHSDSSILDEYKFNQLILDKDNAPKKIDEDLNKKLGEITVDYKLRLENAEKEKDNEFQSIREEYGLEDNSDLEELKNIYSVEIDNWAREDNGEFVNYDDYNKRIEIKDRIKQAVDNWKSEEYRYKSEEENEKTLARNDAEELKNKVKHTTLTSKRAFEDSDIGFDYKLVSDDGRAELYNNSTIESLTSGRVYLELHFGKNIDDFKVIKAVHNNSVSADIYDKLIYKLKMELGNDIKDTTLKYSITEKNMQGASALGYDRMFYDLAYNLNYVMISLVVLFILFIGALITPYKGKSMAVKAYCKLYMEFKIGLIGLSIFVSMALIIYGGIGKFTFIPIFLIASTIAILTGRYFRYITDTGIVNGLFKNFLGVAVFFSVINLFKLWIYRLIGIGGKRDIEEKKAKEKKIKIKKPNVENIEAKANEFIISTGKFKNTILSNIDNKTISKKIGLYVTLALGYLGFGLFLVLLGFKNYEVMIVFFGGIIVISMPIIFWLVSKKFFRQLSEIEEASKGIVKGDFNIDLKERNSRELNVISENLSNINTGFKAAVQGELKSERMKAELITNVSHDLKTPLTSIINYVDLLQKDNNTETQKVEYLNILENKSKRLKVLIEDLFEATKASSGNIALNIEEVDVVAILKQTLGEFKEKIESSGLDFKINMPKEKIILNLDGARTWRVFDNLIGNALKYSMKNSRIYINLVREGDKVIFEIKNISAYELNCDPSELRERFKRGDASRHTEGSGLGLSIANSLVELQGGELIVDIDGDLFKVKIIFYS